MDDSADATQVMDGEVLKALTAFGLSPIRIDSNDFRDSSDVHVFDEPAWELLARAGQVCEMVICSMDDSAGAEAKKFDRDQAVIAGLLARTAKLTRGVFDASQNESEAHGPLSRCLAETAGTLRWMIQKNSPELFQRFRADSFVRLRAQVSEIESEGIEEVDSKIPSQLRRMYDSELVIAGIKESDIPARPNSWGADLRQRYAALNQEYIYNTLFVLHSAYVHPTWHEIRAFHTEYGDDDKFHLTYEFAGLSPIVAIYLARIVAQATGDASQYLGCGLNPKHLERVVRTTVEASEILASEFSVFADTGALEPEWGRRGSRHGNG